MHLRLPAFDHGVISFIWALIFGLFIWIGGSAVGFGSAVTFIVGCVAGFLIFVAVRVYGEDEPRRPCGPASANSRMSARLSPSSSTRRR